MFFNSTPSVSVKEAAQAVKESNTAFIDVRTKAEYASGHAAGARNIPLDTLGGADVANLLKYDAVYVICQSGGRSSSAAGALKKSGVHVFNVSGGTLAWRAEGLPME
jgi:rhodanese-related sulfurtransferase